ncbi:hypothetical protein ISCGN_026196 [Ixodes scapularis]
MLDEEDDLSEVQPDAVPNEVREWLASTFTRQAATQRKRSEDKPRFRSVANAIRAGIMVDSKAAAAPNVTARFPLMSRVRKAEKSARGEECGKSSGTTGGRLSPPLFGEAPRAGSGSPNTPTDPEARRGPGGPSDTVRTIRRPCRAELCHANE